MALGDVALVVADPGERERVAALLREDPRLAGLVVEVGDGGDDTLDRAQAQPPRVVVVAATLESGDGAAFLAALRDLLKPPWPWMVLLGDEHGPIRHAADAGVHAGDRFVAHGEREVALVAAIVEGLVGEPPDAIRVEDGPPREPTQVLGGVPLVDDVPPPVELDAAQLQPVPEPEGEDAGGDFARNLRRKMSAMAQRLFAAGASTPPPAVSARPRHDHHTEIDLGAFAELGRGNTELEEPGATLEPTGTHAGSRPGSTGGGTDAPAATGPVALALGERDVPRLLVRAQHTKFAGALEIAGDGVTRTLQFDDGRLVFAATSAEAERLGALLVREGKVTPVQLRQALAEVAASGRRLGEVLVDRGFLKRRELSPAVRRQLEEILYGACGVRVGTAQWHPGPVVDERVKLTRATAALVLEGLRRKYEAAELWALLGPAPVHLEVVDRDRLALVVGSADLGAEERAALAALDGARDLPAIASAAGLDDASAAALAWGLVVLGVATVRRAATDDDDVLVGESELAIDRERVAARLARVRDADYFTLLGVRPGCTSFELRRAHEAARRDFAPEGFAPELRRELAAQLAEIAEVLDEAFAVLRDAPLRARYAEALLPLPESGT